MPHGLRHITALKGFFVALALGLGGCGAAISTDNAKSLPHPQPTGDQVAARPSAESEAMQVYFASLQADLLSQGLLRTDGGGIDAPFNDRMLADNFIRIALFDEYQPTQNGLIQRETESRLRRWQDPVRVQLQFGASVSAKSRATDRARIGSYLARLSQITGHPIGLSDFAPNFFLQIVNEDERRALGPAIIAAMPSLNAAEVRGLTELPRSTYCIVYALSQGGSSTYTRAYAIIRSEHPDLMRLSCIHEELAQGLGLANDSPQARPSIFNDDEEYAFLTTQDELMLRLLYNPALQPGMTIAQAAPIVRELAHKFLGGAS